MCYGSTITCHSVVTGHVDLVRLIGMMNEYYSGDLSTESLG